MKIGIITFHFAYNCGAVLQCVALCEKLEQMGHEVCVINYQPWYHKNRYMPLKNPFYNCAKRAARRGDNDNVVKQLMRGAKGFLATVYSWRHYPKLRKVDKYFQTFNKNSLNETRIYRTYDQLVKNPPKCDLYISGSDQLWNAKLTEGKLDPAYLLDFGDEGVKKITYAMGVSLDNMNETFEGVKDIITRLDAISLREKECYEDIKKLTGEKVPMHVDVDPTFLLRKEDYDKYICKESLSDEPFIFTYTMMDKSRDEVYKIATHMSEKLGIKLIDASANPKSPSKLLAEHRVCGPAQFLWYIKNAKYVVTNSFHGTAFSVNMEKDFITIPHSHTGYRVTEILDKLGLEDRYAYDSTEGEKIFEKTADYHTAKEKLDALRQESINYLEMHTMK